MGTCSHGRAYEYYIESITSHNSFGTCECNDWNEYNGGSCTCASTTVMGEATPTRYALCKTI